MNLQLMKYLFFLMILIISCKQKEISSIKMAQNEMAKRYKSTIFSVDKEKFSFFRSIKNNRNFEIQLWTKDKRLSGLYEEEIIYINHNKAFAIPLFSNNNRNFWNFDNDDSTANKLNEESQTFKNEFYNMLLCFNITDLLSIAKDLLFETFEILQNNNKVYKNDEYEITIELLSRNNTNSEKDIINTRNSKKIIEEIYSEIRDYNSYWMNLPTNSIWDKFNGRVYKIPKRTFKNGKELLDSIKVFRTGNREILIKI